MLRTRTRSHHKDQAMSQCLYPQSESLEHNSPKPISNHLGLLIGLSNKGSTDCDSVSSPKSPLEFRVYTTMTEPFIRSSRSFSQNAHRLNTMGAAKVGLSIVNSIENDGSLTRDVVFGPAMRIKSPKNQEPKYLPENFSVSPTTQKNKDPASGVIFEIGGDPFDLEEPIISKGRSFSAGFCKSLPVKSGLAVGGTSSRLGEERNNSGEFLDMKSKSTFGSIGCYTMSDIELSEDYTCIISHGPIPKTTHIYGDQVLECHSGLRNNKEKHVQAESDAVFPYTNFLSFCHFCGKKLEDGEDIYMYRGEKAFCSVECRSKEMEMEMDEQLGENIMVNESTKNL